MKNFYIKFSSASSAVKAFIVLFAVTCIFSFAPSTTGAISSTSIILDTGIDNGYGLAFDLSGNLYYASIGGTFGSGGDNAGYVGKINFNLDGSVNSNTAFLNTGLRNPFALAYANDNLYVDEWNGNGCTNSFGALKIYNVTTKASSCPSVSGAPGHSDENDLRGIAISPTGVIYLALGGDNKVAEYSASGSGFLGEFIPSTGLNKPFGVAWCAGDLYVANNGSNSSNGSIQKLVGTGPGRSLTTIATGLSYPSAVVCGPDNNLYVAIQNTPDPAVDNGGSILKIVLGSNVSTSTVLSSGLHAPQGLAFNSSGDLYIMNGNGGSACSSTICGSIVKLSNLVTSTTSTTTQPQIVYSKPTSPSTVTASLSNGTATVSFTPGSSGNLPTYNQIDMFINGQAFGNVCNVTGATSCPIANLGPNTSFSFTVTAVNSKGTAMSAVSNSVSYASTPTAVGDPIGAVGGAPTPTLPPTTTTTLAPNKTDNHLCQGQGHQEDNFC